MRRIVVHMLRHHMELMSIRVLFLVLLFSPISLSAEAFGENPAFCLGFVRALPKADIEDIARSEPGLRRIFAARGPKDSTDERSFEEWGQIGAEAAKDQNDTHYPVLKSRCQQMILKNR